MRILFLSSEIAPFSKTGGLGDVSGALPAALCRLGNEVISMCPLYASTSRATLHPVGQSLTLRFPFQSVSVGYLAAPAHEGVINVLVDMPPFFERPKLYGYDDDARRFAAFSMAALTYCQMIGFAPDILHCNDWQTGLAALARQTGYGHTALAAAKCVMTIHNLSYQGNFPKTEMQALGIPWSHFNVSGVEFYDRLSFLKTGLVYADAITTVSPSYASEIQTVANGCGLDGLLRHRSNDLVGILNGVDSREWNPGSDTFLPQTYEIKSMSGRRACRAELAKRFDIDEPQENWPLFGNVGRMVHQKGTDLLLQSLPRFLEQGASAVVVGSGDAEFEDAWVSLARRFPRKLGVYVGFDSGLAHLVEAGSDFFMMPSRFEPCGLNQMYSLLYGAVPIVHCVGGLRDTVTDISLPGGTGIVFSGSPNDDLNNALVRAVELFRQPQAYARCQRHGMAQDFSWKQSADRYVSLYERLTQ